jgi:hypothetical protein
LDWVFVLFVCLSRVLQKSRFRFHNSAVRAWESPSNWPFSRGF